jgi:hypothetical protein
MRGRKPRPPKAGNAKGMKTKTIKRKMMERWTGQGKLAQMMQEMNLRKLMMKMIVTLMRQKFGR